MSEYSKSKNYNRAATMKATANVVRHKRQKFGGGEEERQVDASNRARVDENSNELQRIIEEMTKERKEMEQALKDKDKEMEAMNAKGKEREEALNAKSKEMEEALNAKSKEMEETLKAKDKELKEAREYCSVEKLLNTFGGLPPLDNNTHPQPPQGSKAGNKKKEKSTLKGSETGQEPTAVLLNGSEGAKKKHLPADIRMMEQPVTHWMDKFKVNFIAKDRQMVKSMIATGMTGTNTSLHNSNEASVATHVSNVLIDVLHCLHLSSAKVVTEMSIFSMRPDIVVVRWNTAIVLVVEVKNPCDCSESVVLNKFAAGQCYDYAMGLRQMGIDRPFVCLTTYTHLRIGSLVASCSDIFDDAADRLKNGTIDDRGTQPLNPKEKTSPEKTGNLILIPVDSKKPSESAEEEIGDTNSDTESRVIHFSEVFDHKNIFKALSFAVSCGIATSESNSSNQQNKVIFPQEGERMNCCVAVVTKDALCWKTIKCTATFCKKTKWHRQMKAYLYCVLGQGCSGKVYLASDSAGRMYALKLYLIDSDTMMAFRASVNEEVKQTQKEWLVAICKDEAEKWKLFYPTFKMAIFQDELYGVPCLAMPYVASIPARSRRGFLPMVESELKRFANKALSYRKADVRWRHIGLRKDAGGNEQIILVDLESMEKCKDTEEAHKAVERAVSQLDERADNEPVIDPRPLIHA